MNPLDNWWEAYAPSQEESEAMKAGFDFKDPKTWFEKKNIDYTLALKATEEAQKKAILEVNTYMLSVIL